MSFINKMSTAGGFKSLARYFNMLAGNTTYDPYAPQNGYDSLATITVGSSGAASIDFAGISAGYKHLQIRWIARNSTNDVDGACENMRIQFNGITAANYPYHLLEGNGSSASAGANTSETSFFSARFPMSNATANAFGAGIIDVVDYSSTNKYKTLRHLGGGDKNGSGYVGLYSGVATNSTSAISAIRLFPQLGSFAQYSQFALYGIR